MSIEFDKEFFSTLIITIVNISVLFLVLRKLLFNRVNDFMDKRTEKIEEGLKNAEEAEKRLEQAQAEKDEILRAAKKEGNELVAMYKTQAEEEYNRIVANAMQEAEKMLEDTRLQLKAERESTIKSIKEEVTELVLSASEKVLGKNVDNSTNRKIISEFISSK